MAGAPLFNVLLLLVCVIVVVAVTHSRRLHPFFALMVVASAFGAFAGLSVGFLGKAFGDGFSRAIYSPGLVIVTAAFVAGVAESTAASDWLAAKIDLRRWCGSTKLAAIAGLVAGVGASPASAFALLTPLLRAVAPNSGAAPIALALAISASHGLLLISPVAVAAASILNAHWTSVALFGLPLAALLAAFAAAWARWLPAAAARGSPPPTPQRLPMPQKRGGWAALVLVVATVIPLLMLMIQSIGDIRSEPLGGGSAREMVLGLGRPLILFLVALGIMVLGLWRPSAKLFADSSRTTRIFAEAAGIVLLVGAAGGLQRLCQETGMAELLGERLLGWRGGVLVAFLIAALIKTLQGSSLVAAITTAGMVQPLLSGLGLNGDNGPALATLAIGAGAMTVSHVNDEYFWLVANSASLSPLRGLTRFSVATLLQGVVAVAVLFVLSVLI